jgi:long-chain acyl-CoA synthetase
MRDREKLTIPSMFAEAAGKYPNANALSFVGERPLSYRQLQLHINSLIAYLEILGVRPGDRVAILGNNMPNWGICYLAACFMGAVVVPLLPDFLPGEIENILDHSGSRVLFVSAGLKPKLENVKAGELKQVIHMEDFSPAGQPDSVPAYDPGRKPRNQYAVSNQDLAAIIYTSGTTGSSKGVMLSHGNICSNVLACRPLHPVKEGDRFLSILPLSHTLENTIGFMVPIMNSACVYYIKKPPSPSVLVSAMKEVRPTIMLSVPMVIEKIYFQRIMPALYGKKAMRVLMRMPFIHHALHRAAGRKLMDSFGGELEFFGIGGAKLNTRVEQFLIDAGFPYAIGYGLTETSPLLAGTMAGKTRLGSTGTAIEGVELKIQDPDPETGEGEIWAKGPNVMQGYYREPKLTAEVLTDDGWFRTGDLGTFDADRNLYIKGRLKNMIVGSSGENIYPEEIEFVINNFRHVVESLVIEQKGKLVALVHINLEEIEQAYQHLREEVSNFMEEKVEEILKEIKEYVNARVNKFSQVHSVVLQSAPFQKTATQKIKRFLYR